MLAKRERRRAVITTTVRSVGAFAVILGIYYLLPVGEWGGDAVSALRLMLGVLFFAASSPGRSAGSCGHGFPRCRPSRR